MEDEFFGKEKGRRKGEVNKGERKRHGSFFFHEENIGAGVGSSHCPQFSIKGREMELTGRDCSIRSANPLGYWPAI